MIFGGSHEKTMTLNPPCQPHCKVAGWGCSEAVGHPVGDGRAIREPGFAFVPPYSVFCSISFRCGGLSIERNQKPLAPEITLAVTHHDRQKQVEVKRSSRVNPHEIRLFSGCPYYFTLPMDGNYNSFTEHLRQPCKERRSFGVDVHHIVFSKCTIKCRKCGGADCSKSPWCQDRDKKILKKSKKISPTRLFWQFFESSGPCRAIRYLMLFYFHTACNGVFSLSLIHIWRCRRRG